MPRPAICSENSYLCSVYVALDRLPTYLEFPFIHWKLAFLVLKFGFSFLPWAILSCTLDCKWLRYILSLNKQRGKLFSSIQTWIVVNLLWKLLTVLHMINSETHIKMIFPAVALLTEHCSRPWFQHLISSELLMILAEGSDKRGEDVISFSSLPF